MHKDKEESIINVYMYPLTDLANMNVSVISGKEVQHLTYSEPIQTSYSSIVSGFNTYCTR